MKKKTALWSALAVLVLASGGYTANTVFLDEPEAQTTPWVCSGPVDIDLVKVRLETHVDDAVILKRGCTGRIGRLEVDTWQTDGVKTRAQGSGPWVSNLVVESGYITCHDQLPGSHQDGIHSQGGFNVTFKNLTIRCGLSNSNFFVSGTIGENIICDGCNLGPDASHTANVHSLTDVGAVPNGVINSVLCKPETKRYFTKHGPTRDENNERALAGDERCN